MISAMLTASLLALFSPNAFSAVLCKKTGAADTRVIRKSFGHTLLPGLTGKPAAGPLFQSCVLQHELFGRYVLLDFSAEGFYGGNNWGQFWALGRFVEQKQIVWIGGGPIGGNTPPPYQVDAVRSGDETWIEWHDAQCVTLSYRGLAVPSGANAAFPNPHWKRVSINFLKCGQCGESASESCTRAVTRNGSPIGERIGY